MRLDAEDHLYILEVNSLPSLGAHGSYVYAAEAAGLEFKDVVNRLVEVASARYFGTPAPPEIQAAEGDAETQLLEYITSSRDLMERGIRDWCERSSRTSDPIGLQQVSREVQRQLSALRLKPVPGLSDPRSVMTMETSAGLEGGTLLIGHLDVPIDGDSPAQPFRREAEWLHGEGIASSRASLIMLLSALRGMRQMRALAKRRIGVLYYMDEGRDCRYSEKIIRQAMSQVRQILVLRPGGSAGSTYNVRRGQRKYRFIAESDATPHGKGSKRPGLMVWFAEKLVACSQLDSRSERIAVSFADIRSESFPMLAPHRISATLHLIYGAAGKADRVEEQMRLLLGRAGPRWELEKLSDRPPMEDRPQSQEILQMMSSIAAKWEIPIKPQSSVWPSVAGLAPGGTGVLCGIGPIGEGLQTPREAVQRISLVQRTILLGMFLLNHA
jgi:D-alanine-D-alanine ligase